MQRKGSTFIRWQDWLPLVLIGIGTTAVALLFYDFSLPPFEDAAMLMRYADHFAAGEGIVFSPGDPPVDGATDFLFMVMVGGLHALGLSLEAAVRVLTIGAHGLTVALLYVILLRVHQVRWYWATGAAAFLALGPALSYIEAYFGTPVFALFGLLTYLQFLRMMARGVQPGTATWFAIWGLVTGLVRPEGVILVLVMLAALLVRLGWKSSRGLLLRFGLIFGGLGGIYFAWHWWYFGYPLPNPFYIKGGGTLHMFSLRMSVMNTFMMAWPVFPLFLFAFWEPALRERTLLLLVPSVAFVFAWILMSNAMNYAMRFQYILLPILLVSWPPGLRYKLAHWETGRLWKMLGIAGFVLLLGYEYLLFHNGPRLYPDGRVAVARRLAPLQGYTMAVTEAGNLPLYSGWRAVDTWGLNDRHIAHQPVVDAAYLDKFRPDVILVHDYWSPGLQKQVRLREWADMTAAIEAYVAQNDYELVACFGVEPYNTHWYYVNRERKNWTTLRDLILGDGYIWYETGTPARNYLLEPFTPPEAVAP